MSPSNIIFLSLALLILSSLITSTIGLNTPLLSLNENQIFYLYSTSAQVLAGVYGLTLTGFIFFRNELSREESEDDTLTEAAESLKNRYFKILMFITILSIFTLLMSNLVISSEGEKNVLTAIMMNIGQSSFVVNLLAIAYFIFDVISPKRIEKESKSIQQKVDPLPVNNVIGSFEVFLSNYNKLENILQKYGQAYQSEFENNQGIIRRRMPNVRLAEVILSEKKIDDQLFEEIKKLITLRNSIIHGAYPIVSEHMVLTSKDILQKLAKALNVGI